MNCSAFYYIQKVFYKNDILKISLKFTEKICVEDLQLYLKLTLAQIFFCELCYTFKNASVEEYHRGTASVYCFRSCISSTSNPIKLKGLNLA